MEVLAIDDAQTRARVVDVARCGGERIELCHKLMQREMNDAPALQHL